MNKYTSIEEAAAHITIRLLPNTTVQSNDRAPCAKIIIPHTSLKISFFLEEEDSLSEITLEHIRRWNISRPELLDVILRRGDGNSIIMPMESAIGLPDKADIPTLTVVTNKSSWYGASAVLFPEIRKTLNRLYPGGCWLIPSSVHEMIAMEANLLPAAYIRKTNIEVNQSMPPDDFLANDLYEFDSFFGLKPVL